METKSGIAIPPELAAELRADERLKNAWELLRPSCQKDYCQRIAKAQPGGQAAKLEQVKRLTMDYAARHPDKYSKRGLSHPMETAHDPGTA